jgi:hypothetical protein
MWQSLGSGYTGLPDERLDASSLGYRNAKKKDSNPLPGVARRERPIAAFHHHLKMLRCGPSERPFAATAKSARGELTDCRTFPTFIFPASLTQHFLTLAAGSFQRRSDFHQTGHWIGQNQVETKLTIRCGLLEPSRRGQNCRLLQRCQW